MQQAEVNQRVAELFTQSEAADDGKVANEQFNRLIRPYLKEMLQEIDDDDFDPYAWDRAIVELHSLFGAYLLHEYADGNGDPFGYSYQEPFAIMVPFEPEGKPAPYWRDYGRWQQDTPLIGSDFAPDPGVGEC